MWSRLLLLSQCHCDAEKRFTEIIEKQVKPTEYPGYYPIVSTYPSPLPLSTINIYIIYTYMCTCYRLPLRLFNMLNGHDDGTLFYEH